MKNLLWTLVLAMIFAGIGIPYAEAAKADPAEILKKADEVRNPSDSYRMKVEVVSGKNESDRSVFEVALSGNTKTFIKTLEPARDHGRNMLMIDEDMWAYIPNLKRAVRVSLSQKLTGQAANGDISRMRWSGDYDAKIEKENKDQWQLFLTANRKGVTYDKIRVWIEKQNFRPLKADFLTPSGKVLKHATYDDYRPRLGQVRPHAMRIVDAVRLDNRSVIRILDMEVKNFPASTFSQTNLR